MRARPLLPALGCLVLGVACSACSLPGDSALVTASFANATAGAFAPSTPAVFGMKVAAIYIVEDVDPGTQDNVGQVGLAYLHPDCNEDIDGCGPLTISSYFDLTQSTAEVNAQINAQERSVPLGTYRYARMELCQGTPAQDVRFQGGAMSAPVEYAYAGCAVTSPAFATPMILDATDSALVTLSYDVANIYAPAIAEALPGQTYCAGAGNTDCLTLPEFVPSASPL
jgi:hypothetical protein